MKIEVKEIYKCDHCNKLYQIKPACATHEVKCVKNPDNFRPCFGCINLCMKTYDLEKGSDQDAYTDEVRVLFCKKKKVFLYPPKVGHKGNAYDFDGENKPMPRECEDEDHGWGE